MGDGQCLGDDVVLAFVMRRLPSERAEAVWGHIAACDDCRTVVAEGARYVFHEWETGGSHHSRMVPA